MKIDTESQLRAELTKVVNSTVVSIPKYRFFEILHEVMDAPSVEYLKECAIESQKHKNGG